MALRPVRPRSDLPLAVDPSSRFLGWITALMVFLAVLALAGLLAEKLAHLPGLIEHGDLCVVEEPHGAAPRRHLPTAIFARWRQNG